MGLKGDYSHAKAFDPLLHPLVYVITDNAPASLESTYEGNRPPGTWHLAPGSPGAPPPPGTWHLAPGTWHLAPGTWQSWPSWQHLAPPGTWRLQADRGSRTA